MAQLEKYVITGGGCVGKTTLGKELERLGYVVVPEAARAIIQEQRPNGILPWTDNSAFQEMVLDRIDANEQAAVSRGASHFFADRGALDGIAYCIESSTPVTVRLAQIACQQHRNPRYSGIFLLDHVGEYQNDNERIEPEEFNRRVHSTIEDVYLMAGYEVVRVPALTVERRAQFILNYVKIHRW